MSQGPVERLATALLYEGYLLYPYRPSAVKNRHRFNFGVLYPERFVEAAAGNDRSFMQTECLVQGDDRTAVTVTVRFLHLASRTSGADSVPWQEAREREVSLGSSSWAELLSGSRRHRFSFPATRTTEPVAETDRPGRTAVRREEPIEGEIEIGATACDDGVVRIRVRVVNGSRFGPSPGADRDEVLLRSLVSAHTVLTVTGGQFISLLEPPERFAVLAAGCANRGTWPVLVGDERLRDTMLSSPITLYDFPAIAPESAGDLFDATEIDEILTLRIMTLTDEEKREIRASDERARRLLDRTESLGAEQLMALHGTVRQPAAEDGPR